MGISSVSSNPLSPKVIPNKVGIWLTTTWKAAPVVKPLTIASLFFKWVEIYLKIIKNLKHNLPNI